MKLGTRYHPATRGRSPRRGRAPWGRSDRPPTLDSAPPPTGEEPMLAAAARAAAGDELSLRIAERRGTRPATPAPEDTDEESKTPVAVEAATETTRWTAGPGAPGPPSWRWTL
eukprot:6359416-Prymnesium_polylepis.1